ANQTLFSPASVSPPSRSPKEFSRLGHNGGHFQKISLFILIYSCSYSSPPGEGEEPPALKTRPCSQGQLKAATLPATGVDLGCVGRGTRHASFYGAIFLV